MVPACMPEICISFAPDSHDTILYCPLILLLSDSNHDTGMEICLIVFANLNYDFNYNYLSTILVIIAIIVVIILS